MAAYAVEIIQANPKLELMSERQSFAVCFRYIPDETDDLNEFNLAIRESLEKQDSQSSITVTWVRIWPSV